MAKTAEETFDDKKRTRRKPEQIVKAIQEGEAKLPSALSERTVALGFLRSNSVPGLWICPVAQVPIVHRGMCFNFSTPMDVQAI
ncbi:MAG: hypothetical protein MI861_24420 [Pirellulales bacterium]|nr:hypothetical protein [Pirellulales bacterium]